MVPTADGKKAVLWTSGWTPRFQGETIFLARATGNARRIAVRQDAPGGHRRRRHGDGVPVAGVRRRRHHRRVAPQAQRDRAGRAQPGDADPHQAGRHAQGGQAQGPGELQLRRPVRVHEGLLASGLPLFALRAADLSHPLPVPPVAVRRVALRETHIRPGCARVGAAAHHHRPRTGTWSPTATSSSPSDRHSGSGAHESETAETPEPCGDRSRTRRRDRLALPPLGGGTQAAQQGVPDPLVVPAGRDRAVQLHRPADHRRVPDAVLRPVDGRGHLQRRVPAAARRRDVARRTRPRSTSASRSAAACSSARSTTGPH